MYFYINIRGLKSKLNDLYCEVPSCSCDVTHFIETWLDSIVYDHEVVDDRYNRRDRDTSSSLQNTGGGILIGIKKEITSILVLENNSKSTKISG